MCLQTLCEVTLTTPAVDMLGPLWLDPRGCPCCAVFMYSWSAGSGASMSLVLSGVPDVTTAAALLLGDGEERVCFHEHACAGDMLSFFPQHNQRRWFQIPQGPGEGPDGDLFSTELHGHWALPQTWVCSLCPQLE